MSQNGWLTHPISLESNVTITDMTANRYSLNFTVSTPNGQTGYVNATVPVGLNQTAIKVFVDEVELIPPPFPIITSNGTHCFIYFEFTLSNHTKQRRLRRKLQRHCLCQHNFYRNANRHPNKRKLHSHIFQVEHYWFC